MKKSHLTKPLSVLLAAASVLLTLSACGTQGTAGVTSLPASETSLPAATESSSRSAETTAETMVTPTPVPVPEVSYPPVTPLDDKYRTYYEVFVYSYADSNGDGIGDFKGLTQKLDYINDGKPETMTDLGANGIWLMPIMPSPTYHKYDVLDYEAIDPQYGSLEDFDQFIQAAHKRGIDVIIDLVMNHTAVDHPWFKQAVEALKAGDLENPYVSYYNFSNEKKDDTWYATGATGWYYEGKFWSGMPDLNLASEAVRQEFTDIMQFWLIDHDVDGFRLDAVKEFYSGNTPANIEVLTWINQTAKSIRPDAYLVGEAWTTFQEYKRYYESGVDSFMDFSFADYSGITVKDINTGNGQDYATQLANAQSLLLEINPHAINAPFLSNHDTGRLAGFLGSDPGKLRAAALANLFTSGNSFIYYGEELGMKGSGRDENKRTALPWGPPGTDYLTTGPADKEEGKYGSPFGTVAEQTQDPASLLSFYREAIRIRQLYPEIARGLTTVAEGFAEKAFVPIEKNWTDSNGATHQALVIMNFSWENRSDALPEAYQAWELVAALPSAEMERGTLTGQSIEIPAYSAVILKPAA